MQKVYTKIESIVGNVVTVRAEDVRLGDLALVGDSYATVIKLDNDIVSLQVFAGAQGVGTRDTIRFLGRPMIYYPGKQGKDYFLTAHLFKHGRKTLFSYLSIFWNWLYIVGIFVVILVKPSFNFKNIITLNEGETATHDTNLRNSGNDNEDVKIYADK